MIRTTTLARTAIRAPRIITSQASARRWASASTTHAPTDVSGSARQVGVSAQLAPGEEIDPQLNGYPQLPYVSLQTREPFGWWDRQERKNFGEVVHEEEDALGMWGPDVHKISGGTALLSLLGAFTAIAALGYGISVIRPERVSAPREYPYGGLEKELGGHVAARAESEVDDE